METTTNRTKPLEIISRDLRSGVTRHYTGHQADVRFDPQSQQITDCLHVLPAAVASHLHKHNWYAEEQLTQ